MLTRRSFLSGLSAVALFFGLRAAPAGARKLTPEEMLDNAVAEFEGSFDRVMTSVEFIAHVSSARHPVWLAPDGSEFEEHTHAGLKPEGARIDLAPAPAAAVSAWLAHVSGLPRTSDSVLYWRIEPEIQQDAECYGGGWKVYSRFAIGSPKLMTGDDWRDWHMRQSEGR
jgi:hypothetical protein